MSGLGSTVGDARKKLVAATEAGDLAVRLTEYVQSLADENTRCVAPETCEPCAGRRGAINDLLDILAGGTA